MGGRLRRGAAVVGAVTVNVAELVVLDALRSWVRHAGSIAPAVGSTALVLLLLGTGALSTIVVRTVAADESRDATLLHVYLKDDDSGEQVANLERELASNPDVVAVTFVSKDDALRQARSRPGMSGLLDQVEGNPLPAGFDVRLRNLTAVAPLAASLDGDTRLDAEQPTSYDSASYQALDRIVRIVELATLAGVLALALISAGVTASAIRATAVARADEVRTMRLVGAAAWMIRGPFVLEGGLTGIAGGLLAAGALWLLCSLLAQAFGAPLPIALPGLTVGTTVLAASALLPVGAGLGSLSATFAVRGRRL